MRIIVVRHGETDWNREGRFQGDLDVPLNEHGLKQAEILSIALAKEKIDIIFSSPLRRALDTAKAIAMRQSAPIFVKDELKEISFGEWEGLLASEVKRRYSEVYEIWKREPEKALVPSGESLEMVLHRVNSLLYPMLDRYDKETVLIVGHGGVNKVLFCSLLGLPLSYFWVFRQDNASLSILERRDDGKFSLRVFNDTCHLCMADNYVEGAP